MDKIIDPDLDRVKQEIKIRYKPDDYEALIEFAAKYFISDFRRRIEMDNFHKAMLNMEFAKADHNKELQKAVEENYQKNILFQEVLLHKSLSGTFHSWKMNKKKHENDKKAKELVREWWANDKNNLISKADVIDGYRIRLREAKISPSPKKLTYESEVLYDWLTNL